jgi:hypothetical protein
MRRSTLVVAGTCAVLATAAVYLAIVWDSPRPEEAIANDTPATVTGQEASPALPTPTPVQNGVPQQDRRSTAPADDQARAAEAAAVRALLDDPTTRTKIRDGKVDLYRSDMPGGFTRFVGLSDAEYARLMDLLTDQQLERLQAQFECVVQPGCDVNHVMQTLVPVQRRALEAMLGAERARRLDEFHDNTSVRPSVAHLRDILPESQRFSDEQADQLVAALGAERRRAIHEIQQRGASHGFIAGGEGDILISSTSESVEQKYDEAREYQRRMHERASAYLNAEQLRVYRQMQEDWLRKIRAGWEKEAAARDAR